MSTFQLAVDAGQAVVAAGGDGLIDWGNTKVGEVTGLLRGVAGVAGVLFVLWQGIASRGAMARIIVSGLAAGVFLWIVWNVTDLRDRVDNEVNAVPAVVAQPHTPPA